MSDNAFLSIFVAVIGFSLAAISCSEQHDAKPNTTTFYRDPNNCLWVAKDLGTWQPVLDPNNKQICSGTISDLKQEQPKP